METENKTVIEPQPAAERNSTAIIAYLTIIGLVVAFVMNNEKKSLLPGFISASRWNMVTGIALSIINVIPILGWIISIIGFSL